MEGAEVQSVWLWMETGGEVAPVVTVRGLSCVDSSWSIAPRCEEDKSTGMLTELCAEEGRDSRGMYTPGEGALVASGGHTEAAPLARKWLLGGAGTTRGSAPAPPEVGSADRVDAVREVVVRAVALLYSELLPGVGCGAPVVTVQVGADVGPGAGPHGAERVVRRLSAVCIGSTRLSRQKPSGLLPRLEVAVAPVVTVGRDCAVVR